MEEEQTIAAKGRATAELLDVCCREARTRRPARDRWQNEDVWQDTFVRLALRIAQGKVDLDRPLGPLARKTAFRLFLREQERKERLLGLNDGLLHRFRQSEELLPEDVAESSWRAAALRDALVRICAEDKLSERDVAILFLRYVEGWEAAEVADELAIGVANVRQICARRLQLLRGEMADLGLAESPPPARQV